MAGLDWAWELPTNMTILTDEETFDSQSQTVSIKPTERTCTTG